MDEQMVVLATKFLDVVGRNSYSWVSTKMEQAKGANKKEEQQVIYGEIINELLQDKTELEFIAKQYKEAYERVTISDKDIEYRVSSRNN